MNSENSIIGELYEMFKKPWCGGFPLYFVFFVIIINGLGVWCAISMGTDIKENISKNLAIYSLSVFAPSLYVLILDTIKDEIKHKIRFLVIGLSVCIGYIFMIPKAYEGSVCWACISTIIALFFWVLANRNNIYFNDDLFDKSIKEGQKRHEDNWG